MHVNKIFIFLTFLVISLSAMENNLAQKVFNAAKDGDSKGIDYLSEVVNVNIRDVDFMTPLMIAAGSIQGFSNVQKKQDLERTVASLLRRGALVDLQDKDGQTVLHKAAIIGNHKVMQMLLRFSNNINLRDNDGGTALHAAIKGMSWRPYDWLSRHIKVIKLLVKYKINSSIQDNTGRTAQAYLFNQGVRLSNVERDELRALLDQAGK